MNWPYELFIGWRYLKAKRRQTFISIITFISIAGVAVGVMALIVVLSVMSGFERELREKILGVNSHFMVMRLGGGMAEYKEVMTRVQQVPEVVSVSPFITGQVLITSSLASQGVVLRGIDPQTAGQVTDLGKKLTEGSLAALSAGKRPGIIMGKELARRMGVLLGNVVRVISPGGHITPLGVMPRSKLFTLVGIFDAGLYEYDTSLAYISLGEAQVFLGLGDQVTGLEAKVEDIYRAGEVAGRTKKSLGLSYFTQDWMQMNRSLFSALRLEKVTMFIILALIVLVAAFNIVSTLIMVVMEKNKDIAVLKSMGARNSSIMRIFIFEGLVIGVIGTLLGVLAGLSLASSLEGVVVFVERLFRFKILPPSVYYIDKFPVQINYSDVGLIALSALILSLAATLYPSWQAARVAPAQALRYE